MNHEQLEEYKDDEQVVFMDESYRIQGAVFEVSRKMGCGFLEAVYQECLEKEFVRRQIPFVAQPELTLSYKGSRLKQTYQPDFICYGKIIVEIKALSDITPEHHAQVMNYLKATGLELGLLVNFGTYPKAIIKRIATRGYKRFTERESTSNNHEKHKNKI